MDVKKYAEMLKSYNAKTLEEMGHKYSKDLVQDFCYAHYNYFTTKINLVDFNGSNLVYSPSLKNAVIVREFNNLTYPKDNISIVELEEEIYSTLSIENIGATRKEIVTNNDKKLYGIIEGYKYIANKISV